MLRAGNSRMLVRAVRGMALACPLLACLLVAAPAPARGAQSASARAKAKAARVIETDQQRAESVYSAMQQHLFIPATGLYVGEPVGYSYLWPFSQALAATIMLSEVPGLKSSYEDEVGARLSALQSYWDTDNSEEPEGSYTSTLPAYDNSVVPPTGPGGTKFYDDNEWVGLELVRAYKLTGNTTALSQAQQIMAFVMAGWQTDPGFPCPGGIPFSNAANLNGERNLVTAGPGAELGAQLYGVTGSTVDLRFAEQAYVWARTCLLQANDLYADRFGAKGKLMTATWSYNQGTMIGAGTLLYQATGNEDFLSQAKQTAQASLEHFTPDVLAGENPFFPAVYFRNLIYLDSVTGEAPGKQIAQHYVNRLWEHDKLASGQYSIGSYGTQLLVQASMVEIYAMLCSSPSTYF